MEKKTDLVYGVSDRPKMPRALVLALQQFLAIVASTIAMPVIVGNGLTTGEALLGASVGTLVYLLLTKFKSPVFLGSSFSYIGSMTAAFAGGVSASLGYLGIIAGAAMAGSFYLIMALVVKLCGTNWIDKLMPVVIIGPVVMLIGLVLAPKGITKMLDGAVFENDAFTMNLKAWISLLCGLVTFGLVVFFATLKKGFLRLIPYVLGIAGGFLLSLIFTGFGYLCNVEDLKIVSFEAFKNMDWAPKFAFVRAFSGNYDFGSYNGGEYFVRIALAYLPVALVSFSEHIADHKNLSTIIGGDLIKDPGLTRTLLGDGLGSITGAFIGGCPNTTYGESISCVMLSKNASVYSILGACIMGVLFSFFAPFNAFFQILPECVVGGICFAAFGAIALSGLRMLQNVDLSDNANVFIIASVLVAGLGSMALRIAGIEFSTIFVALVIGILVNQLCRINNRQSKRVVEDSKIEESNTEAEELENNKSEE